MGSDLMQILTVIAEFVDNELNVETIRAMTARLNKDMADFLGPDRTIQVVVHGGDLDVMIEDRIRARCASPISRNGLVSHVI